MAQRRFKRVNREDFQKDYERRTKRGPQFIKEGIDVFIPKEGENLIRIIPPLEGDNMADSIGADVGIHYLENGHFICPKSLDPNAYDPICDARAKVSKTDPDLAKSLKPRLSVLVWVLDLADEDNPKVKLWISSQRMINQDCLKAAKNRRTGELYSLHDPDDGHPIFFERTGRNKTDTRYAGFQVDMEPYPLDDWVLDEIDYFENILNFSEDSDLDAAVSELLAVPSDDEEEDEEDPPPRRSRGRSRREEPEDGTTEEVEEEEQPRERSRRSRREEPGEAKEESGSDDTQSVRERLRNRASRVRNRR